MNITKTEATTVRAIVDVADEFKIVPPAFAGVVADARRKLDGIREDADVDVTVTEAAGLLATTWAYLERSNVSLMPSTIADAINGVWMKLQLAQRDRPVVVYFENGDGGAGWYIMVNGSIDHGPFETEDRAMFFWECKPCHV